MLLRITQRIGITSALLGLLLACSPTQKTIDPEPQKPGVPTAVGKPLGTLTSKTIGPAGGTLTSADGSMTLRFPAGALSKETLITAQPVENTAFGAAGVGYEFGPHGTKFAKPVTLSWTYKAGDLRGSSPEALGIAYQDDQGIWRGHSNLVVDAPQHRVVAPLYHFSRYSFYENFWVEPVEKTVAPNETVNMRVYFQENHSTYGSDGSLYRPDTLVYKDINDMLTPLVPTVELLKPDQVKNWKINGQDNVTNPDSPVGFFGYNEGKSVYYRAPSKAPEANPVAVSVEVVLPGKGKLILISNLTIESPNELYINGSKLKSVYAEANLSDYGAEMMLSERGKNQDRQASVFLQLIGKGVGTYALSKENEVKVALSATDAQNVDYYYTYVPDVGNRVYGPGSVTITEYNARDQLIAGSFSATLHYYNREKKEYKSLKVSGKFRTGGA